MAIVLVAIPTIDIVAIREVVLEKLVKFHIGSVAIPPTTTIFSETSISIILPPSPLAHGVGDQSGFLNCNVSPEEIPVLIVDPRAIKGIFSLKTKVSPKVIPAVIPVLRVTTEVNPSPMTSVDPTPTISILFPSFIS